MEIIDGQVFNGTTKLYFGDYFIVREISRGANGIVYEASDDLLNRKIAIKVWTKLRANDRRDKIEQGILEARKAYGAKREYVVEIFHAGITQNHFFIVMEYVNGIPLRNFLQKEFSPLPRRLQFARLFLDTCTELHKGHIFHGDLHANNLLLVHPPELDYYGNPSNGILLHGNANFKIIDFGTSHFSSSSFSKRRHFELIISLINELAYPFSAAEIYGYAYPEGNSWKKIEIWLRQFLEYIRGSLIELGYKQLENYLYYEHDAVPFWDVPPKQFVENMRALLNGITLDDNFLGGLYLWDG